MPRLFVALELPDNVIAELQSTQKQLRQFQPALPVKWVGSHAYHLTLFFLGEVAERQVTPILHALRETGWCLPSGTQERPDVTFPTLRLAPVGVFPNLKRPQTIWMGVTGDLLLLEHMQQQVVNVLQPLGFAAEKRKFHAHLTLGRVRREATPARFADIRAALEHLQPPADHTWQSGPPLLFQSILKPTGAEYRKIENI